MGVIFILDDEPLNVSALARMLKLLGRSSIGATNVVDAKVRVRGANEPIDLFIVDVGMLAIGAREVLALLPNVKALYMSGYALEHLPIEVPPEAFLPKPIELEALRTMLAKC